METRLLRGRRETRTHNIFERFGRRTHIVRLCCLLPHLCTLAWSGGVWSNNCVSRLDGSHRRREKRYCCAPLTLFTSLSPSLSDLDSPSCWLRCLLPFERDGWTVQKRRRVSNKQHKKTDVFLHLIASPAHSWVYEFSFKSSCWFVLCLIILFFIIIKIHTH